MERTERVILTNMCMLRDGSKVLVEEKVIGDTKGIIFPGGHVEEHEPIVDSVIREMREETGLTVLHPMLCGVKNWINEDGSRYVVFLFRAEAYTGALTSSQEGRVFWAEAEDVLKMPWIWEMDSLMKIFVDGSYAELYMTPEHGWRAELK